MTFLSPWTIITPHCNLGWQLEIWCHLQNSITTKLVDYVMTWVLNFPCLIHSILLVYFPKDHESGAAAHHHMWSCVNVNTFITNAIAAIDCAVTTGAIIRAVNSESIKILLITKVTDDVMMVLDINVTWRGRQCMHFNISKSLLCLRCCFILNDYLCFCLLMSKKLSIMMLLSQ